MRRVWHFGVITGSGIVQPYSTTYTWDHLAAWMQVHGTHRTLIDLPELKLVASSEGDQLYLWWKEN